MIQRFHISAVYNVEIVLTGILRQKLENSPLYRVTPVRPPLQQSPSTQQNNAQRGGQPNRAQRVTA